jgi:hypothetical protein
MWKRSEAKIALCGAVAGALLLACAFVPRISAQGPQPSPPQEEIQEKMRRACLSCHTASIIVQQQLDRRVWAKEVDKMIRWGAPVTPEDRDAMIDYLSQRFGPRPAEPEAALAPGPGQEKVRSACLGCHGAGMIAHEPRERRGWERIVDRMTLWGAPAQAADRELIVDYLTKNYSPPAKTEKQEKKQ